MKHVAIDNPREESVTIVAKGLAAALHERIWPEHTEIAYLRQEALAAGIDPASLGLQ